MATNKLQWKRIAKGDRLPCDSLLMEKDGTIPSVVSCDGVKVGQDAYYLPVDDVIEEIRNYPIEESEDEKMRKELFERFSHIKGFDWYGLPIKDILAWLEKQGEHAKFRDSIQVGDKVTRNEDGILVNLSQLNRVAKKDEKQGKQKPVEWSEEDETNIGRAIDIIKDAKEGLTSYKTDDGIYECEQAIKVLDKLLKNGYSVLWNKADYTNIEKLIKILPQCIFRHPSILERDECRDLIDWLKSLRPQSQWKPSDEQIKVLEFFIPYVTECSVVLQKSKDTLSSLLSDLKKLREE